MKQILHTITVKTTEKETFIPITTNVQNILKESKIKDGIAIVYTPHTTAGITLNENADPDVLNDLTYAYKKTFPNDSNFLHGEGNSDAHLKSSLTGVSETLIISNTKLLLGVWQGLYFCEFDGPRKRKVYIKILGD
ncbi:MAG: secondary thiamine-phosphate synthase enzyme YjbQ [Candidatus Izemoplasmataceae bacterium]